MRSLLVAVLALFALTGATHAQEEDKSLVTILTAPEPQTQLMAMVLTMQAAQQGADTHILLCGPAADMALKDAPESATAPQPPRDMSPQGLMTAIMQKAGGRVEVCAIYLPALGADESVLIDGVTAAKPDAMAAAIMDASRVISF
jgi:predicted peroxiredoxin